MKPIPENDKQKLPRSYRLWKFILLPAILGNTSLAVLPIWSNSDVVILLLLLLLLLEVNSYLITLEINLFILAKLIITVANETCVVFIIVAKEYLICKHIGFNFKSNKNHKHSRWNVEYTAWKK